MKIYNCIILDDDEIDRLTVISYVKRYPNINILATFSNPEECLEFCENNIVDILFLDIEMPELTGLEIRKKLLEIPVCIYITSYPEHAVESFQLDTLDYIIKPITKERFESAVVRISDYLELKEKADLFESSLGGDAIYIKEGHNKVKVKLHDILYLEGLKDYTKIITENKKYCVLQSIGNLLKETQFQSFIRVHRSFAVQKNFIQKKLSAEVLLNNGALIPIGRSFKDNLSSFL